MTCEHCGAAIKDAGAFCSHCGTRITRPERTEPAIRTATDPARYDLAKASPGYEVAMAHVPSVPTVAGIALPLVFLVFGIGFLVLAATRFTAGEDPMFRALFTAIPGVFVAIAGWMVIKGISFANAPIRKEVLVVVDERIEVRSGSNNHSTSTSYYASLHYRDGDRLEYETYGWLAGRIAPGDIGVAFLKGGHLVDFLRLEA